MDMTPEIKKPIIGFSCGDLNGIGLEIIIKSLSDNRLLDFMVPVIFANNKAVNFYKKGLPDFQLNYATAPDLDKLNPKQVNLIQCWEEEAEIQPGELTEIGGKYALKHTTRDVRCVVKDIRYKIDINTLTPVEALMKLDEIQRLLKN